MNIKNYWTLTKPGIIMGNAITAAAGFALASKGHFDWLLFSAMLSGISLIIASACVFNNYIDRATDEKMVRTRNRPLVKGTITSRNALLFGSALGVAGVVILALYTNLLTVCLAVGGLLAYVVLYSLLKYRTVYGTVIGSISGAVPPVVGYCAVTDRFDLGALILYLIVVLWQMPHFFAIALYRLDDYAAAGIPVLPLVKGMRTTKIHMLIYVVAFTGATALLTVFGYTGYAYLAVALVLGLSWLALCINGFKSANNSLWARRMFIHSLVVVMVLCAMITIDSI